VDVCGRSPISTRMAGRWCQSNVVAAGAEARPADNNQPHDRVLPARELTSRVRCPGGEGRPTCCSSDRTHRWSNDRETRSGLTSALDHSARSNRPLVAGRAQFVPCNAAGFSDAPRGPIGVQQSLGTGPQDQRSAELLAAERNHLIDTRGTSSGTDAATIPGATYARRHRRWHCALLGGIVLRI